MVMMRSNARAKVRVFAVCSKWCGGACARVCVPGQCGVLRGRSARCPGAVGTLPVGLPHYLETFMQAVTAVSIKQLYGWAAYACFALLLLFLLYDSPLRRDTKLMPAWQQVRRQVAASLPGRKRGRVMRLFRRLP